MHRDGRWRAGADVSKRTVLRGWSVYRIFEAYVVRGTLCDPALCRPFTAHLLAADVIPKGSPTRILITDKGKVRAEARLLICA